ncbi:MAG: hypothetical protein KDI83_10510, partial [Gammaproteobacteria bacterium]|nr:hypothetical protein [Gammaproteobacteria bacterium]
MATNAELIMQAMSMLEQGRSDFDTLLPLAEALISQNEFALARRVLERLAEQSIAKPEERLRVVRKRALATYKDP